jgi:hypothetical protein
MSRNACAEGPPPSSSHRRANPIHTPLEPKVTMPTPTTLPSPQCKPPQHASSSWSRIRRAAVELTPDAIEQIAQRVAQLLHDRTPSRSPEISSAPTQLLDAGELARHLGVTRAWVYQHDNELGAIRLGNGSKARLRFDLDIARAACESRRGELRPLPGSSRAPSVSRRHPGRQPSATPLLPVSPPRALGILSRFRASRRSSR